MTELDSVDSYFGLGRWILGERTINRATPAIDRPPVSSCGMICDFAARQSMVGVSFFHPPISIFVRIVGFERKTGGGNRKKNNFKGGEKRKLVSFFSFFFSC